MNDRLERVMAAVIVAGAAVLAGWWKSVGTAPMLVAMGVSVVAFVVVDAWLTTRAAPSPTAPLATAAVAETVEPEVDGADVQATERLHQPLAGDSDPGASGSSDDQRLFWVRIPKHGNTMSECEDALAWSDDGSTLVVSDGASSSFGAAAWAELLADRFAADPPTTISNESFESWLDGCRRAMVGHVEDSSTTTAWWAAEGNRRGAFATIAGVHLERSNGRRQAVAMHVGDSCVMVVRGGAGEWRAVRSVPFDDAGQFNSYPVLVGSTDQAVVPEPSWTPLNVEPGDVVVVASDAVSEWLLADAARLAVLDLPPADLGSRLRAERAAGRIVNDDLAVAGVTIR